MTRREACVRSHGHTSQGERTQHSFQVCPPAARGCAVPTALTATHLPPHPLPAEAPPCARRAEKYKQPKNIPAGARGGGRSHEEVPRRDRGAAHGQEPAGRLGGRAQVCVCASGRLPSRGPGPGGCGERHGPSLPCGATGRGQGQPRGGPATTRPAGGARGKWDGSRGTSPEPAPAPLHHI